MTQKIMKGHKRSLKVTKGHERSKKVIKGHKWSIKVSIGLFRTKGTLIVQKVKPKKLSESKFRFLTTN